MKELPKDKIEEIVNESDSVGMALVGLYKEVMPRWDDIETMKASGVKCNNNTSTAIIEALLKRFSDCKQEIMMFWTNQGFSGFHNNLPDFQIDVDINTITYK